MGAGNYDIKDILKFLVELFTGIGDMIVTTEALSTISEDVGKYVVISLPAKVYDMGGYGMTTAMISLWARAKSFTSGSSTFSGEDVSTLSTMQESAYAKIPSRSDKYHIANPIVFAGGQKNGFYVWHIQCDLIIH